MQNRFVGDIGDFPKYGLLRALSAGTDLRLGVIWYLTADGAETQGNHVEYLERDSAGLGACDPDLYASLRTLVREGRRNVAAVAQSGILPPGSVFFEDVLANDTKSTTAARLAQRAEWVRRASFETRACDLLLIDPDIGLESTSVARTARFGPRYAYYDELLPLVYRGQSLVIYHHLDRSGPAEYQAKARMEQIQNRLGTELVVALQFLRVSSRFFFVVAAERHETLLSERITRLRSGPWSPHFRLYQPFDPS